MNITTSDTERDKLSELVKLYYTYDTQHINIVNEMINKYVFNFMKRKLGYITVGDMDTFYANQFKANDEEENKTKTIDETNYDNDYDKECMLIQIEKYDDGEIYPLQNFGYEANAHIISNESWEMFHNALIDGIKSLLRDIKIKIDTNIIIPYEDKEILTLILCFFKDMAEDIELQITDEVNEIVYKRTNEYIAYIENYYYEHVIKELRKENDKLKEQFDNINNKYNELMNEYEEQRKQNIDMLDKIFDILNDLTDSYNDYEEDNN